MANLRLWMLPYRQRVLSEVNSYTELSHESHNEQVRNMARSRVVDKARMDLHKKMSSGDVEEVKSEGGESRETEAGG